MFRFWQRAAWGLLVIATASSSVVYAQDPSGQYMSRVFEKTSVNFGTVASHAETRLRIPIRNTYKEPLHIQNVSTSCGCISARVSTDTLASLETGYLELTLDTIRHNGQKNVKAFVSFDAPVNETITIPVSAYIRTDIQLEPGSSQFGHISKGSPEERKVRIQYGGGRDTWRITHIVCKNPNIEPKVVEMNRGYGRVEYELSIKLKANTPVGDLRDQIVLVTDDASSPNLPIIVEGRVEPEYMVSPHDVPFGTLAPGQRRTINIVVRGRKPFQIQRVESEKLAGVFEVRMPQEAKAKLIHVIPLTMIAPANQGEVDEKFTLTIKDVNEPVHFRVLGKVVGVASPPPTTAVAN